MKNRFISKIISGITLLAALIIIVGCQNAGGHNNSFASPTENTKPTPSPVTVSGNFRSDKSFLTVNVPAGWGTADGPESLAPNGHLWGQVAFNNWGENAFWARAIQTGNGSQYSPQTVMQQIPDGGAYVVLVRTQRPPPMPGTDPPEYTLNDFSGLLKPHDWRLDARNVPQYFNFFKWGRALGLEIVCRDDASDATVSQLNDLLLSWRFDTVPVGDMEWAGTQARLLLPKQVDPLFFDIQPSWHSAPGNLARVTEAEVRGTTVHFRFTYIWNAQPSGSIPATIPPDSSHWWEIDVLPTGQAVLTGQGGPPLPTPSPPSGTVTSDGTSAKVVSAGGVILSLSLNSGTYLSGQEVQIVVDEQNPASDSKTVPAARD